MWGRACEPTRQADFEWILVNSSVHSVPSARMMANSVLTANPTTPTGVSLSDCIHREAAGCVGFVALHKQSWADPRCASIPTIHRPARSLHLLPAHSLPLGCQIWMLRGSATRTGAAAYVSPVRAYKR